MTYMEAKTTTVYIPCKVSLGMFDNEVGVTIKLPSGEEVVAFVDQRDVKVKEKIPEGRDIDGKLLVRLIEKTNNQAIIELPQPSIAHGLRIRVPYDLLKVE